VLFYITLVIGSHPLQTTNGNRFLLYPSSAASRLTGSVASTTEHSGKNIGIPIDHVSFGVFSLSNQTDVFRNGSMSRTSVLAVDYFMEVLRIVDVGWFQSENKILIP
jgi:hypothetical protein